MSYTCFQTTRPDAHHCCKQAKIWAASFVFTSFCTSEVTITSCGKNFCVVHIHVTPHSGKNCSRGAEFHFHFDTVYDPPRPRRPARRPRRAQRKGRASSLTWRPGSSEEHIQQECAREIFALNHQRTWFHLKSSLMEGRTPSSPVMWLSWERKSFRALKEWYRCFCAWLSDWVCVCVCAGTEWLACV